MNTIVYQFEKQVTLHPNSIAVKFNGEMYTYRQLNNYANYIAESLIQMGVKPSSVIAISGSKSIEMIASIIAALKLKCIYMPIDISLPTEQIHYMLINANACVVISYGVINPIVRFSEFPHIDLNYSRHNEKTTYSNLNYEIEPSDPAYIMHTSGSTGRPKGVVVPHRAIIRLLVDTNYIEINHTDVILFHSNISFDAAIFEVWSALLNGSSIVISSNIIGDIPNIFKLCKENSITVLLLTTGLFHIFSGMPLEELTALKYLVVGGDVMHSACARRVIKKNRNLKIINGYGPAENAVFTTCLVINKESDIGNPVSIGKPITKTQVYLLDEEQDEVKPGEVGEIYTSGDGLALGYINAPEFTEKKFVVIPKIAGLNRLYRTGDLARLLPSGNFEFIGRTDNQVKIRGFRVDLTEIERTISELCYVEDVCVTTIKREKNKRLIAYVKVNNSDCLNTMYVKTEINEFLRNRLPAYCIPSYIEMRNYLPLTKNGKIDRKFLRTNFKNKNEASYEGNP